MRNLCHWVTLISYFMSYIIYFRNSYLDLDNVCLLFTQVCFEISYWTKATPEILCHQMVSVIN